MILRLTVHSYSNQVINTNIGIRTWIYGHLWSFDFQQVFQDNSLGKSIILGVETAVCMCEEKKKKKRILNPTSQHSQKSIINRL